MNTSFRKPGRLETAWREAGNGWQWVGLALVIMAGGLLLAGCSSKRYLKAADKEVYQIIKNKSGAVTNMESNFSIETNAMVALNDLPILTNADLSLGEAGEAEKGARILPLARALEIFVKNSRTYQNQKETLYSEALSLTLARYRFTPIFSSGVSPRYTGEQVKNEVDKITETHTVSGSPTLGMDVLLRSGARIATDFSMDFTKFLMGGGDMRTMSSMRLGATLSQPLLRNAGYKATMENLTQAERNLLYALRTFVQNRRQNTVDITSAYYRVLRSRDQARNYWDGYQAFKIKAARQRAFVNEGQRMQSDLRRLEQEELTTITSWINAVRSYKQSLDAFKVQLGLSMDAKVVLDIRELEKLSIIHPTINVEDATKVALMNRLDLYTQRDRYEDAARKIDLAKQGLKPDLDLVLQASANSQPGSGLPQLDYSRVNWSGGFDLKLPLDRKTERNTYRTALISYARALRELELAVDNIKLAVVDSLRNLDQAKRNYESSVLGVDISGQRVAEQDLRAELGRVNSEEQIAAQNSYINSLNDRTGALINHMVARLSLWRDLGILQNRENGQWEEISDVIKQ